MKSFNFKNLLSLSLLAGLVVLSSCGEDGDDPIAAPEASFTSEISGKTVVFTNTSEGEDVTYAWDFGDGSTSSEESPEHTYEANGSYIVKLTATNEGGSDDSEGALEIINVIIDGDLSDWDDVPAAITYTDGEGGTITQLKLENLGANKLYVYVAGTSELRGFFNVYLNSDGDVSTGAANDVYYPAGMGAEYLAQGQIAKTDAEGTGDAPIFRDNPNSDEWCWEEDCDASNGLTTFVASGAFAASSLVSSEGSKAMEFSIDLTTLIDVSDEKIGIAINDVAETWVEQGGIPIYQTEESELYIYTLK